jgi:hypothetical protein
MFVVISSLASLAGTLIGGAAAFGSTTTPSPTSGGTVNFYATPGNGDGLSAVVLTGAIGDYGRGGGNTDKNGKADKNGNYGTLLLKQGTITADVSKLNALGNSAQPVMHAATCSAELSVSAPITLVRGTGRYKGITGTLTLTETYAVVFSRFASGKNKGQCNDGNNANPVSSWGSVTGSGTVSLS